MTELSQAYWDGAREGRLVLQRCARCRLIRHYPQPLCPACHSFDVEHVEASGRGEVHSWTVTHHPFSPETRDEVPYVLLTVDLAEGVRMLGRLAGTRPPRIGLPVSVTFEPTGADRPIPVFTPSSRLD